MSKASLDPNPPPLTKGSRGSGSKFKVSGLRLLGLRGFRVYNRVQG